jgi:hypothetical protein
MMQHIPKNTYKKDDKPPKYKKDIKNLRPNQKPNRKRREKE